MFSRLTIFPILSLILIALIGSACHKDEPGNNQHPKAIETSILLYAVASNNLSPNFYDDLQEMEIGLEKVDLSKADYYVYYVSQGLDTGPVLTKAVKDKKTGEVGFEEIKRYDRETSSVDPRRISEVIEDYSALSKGTTKGLILWSHSTAWVPGARSVTKTAPMEYTESETETQGLTRFEPEVIRWWGMDTYHGVTEYCDLPDLADAVPDNYFDFIWFDCCYMSSIEVIYEMRNKAKTFVAYPTEVLAEGAPYHLVLPLIAVPEPNLIAAADAMSDYFLSGNKIFTIAVIDPAQIEEIADLAAQAVPGTRERYTRLLKYSRGGLYFYDFAQYTSTWGKSLGEDWDAAQFSSLMNKLIIYKNCGNRLFNGDLINKENFSGISCAYFTYNPDSEFEETDSENQKYYLELEWFKRVFEPFWPAMNQK